MNSPYASPVCPPREGRRGILTVMREWKYAIMLVVVIGLYYWAFVGLRKRFHMYGGYGVDFYYYSFDPGINKFSTTLFAPLVYATGASRESDVDLDTIFDIPPRFKVVYLEESIVRCKSMLLD